MDKLYANILNECEKILAKKKNIVFLCITTLLAVVTAVLIPFVQSKFGIIAVTAQNFIVTLLNLFTSFLLPLLILMTTTELFSGEVHDKNMKLVLLRPVSRFKVFLSKNIAVLFYLLLNLVVIFIASLICEFFYKLPGSYVHAFFNGLIATIVSILPLFILITFTALVCQFFNSSTGAFASSIFILVIAKVLSLLFPAISKILFINYFNWSSLWLSALPMGMKLFTAFMLLISYGIIFFTMGFYLFDRKEL